MSVQELLQLPENSRCADCGQPGPVWASCRVGVFVCLECSGVHRISSIGKVKSTQLDYMDHDLIEFMRCHGNRRAREEYEAFVPPFYYRPNDKDCKVLREQWIRAKYERREFTSEAESVYAVGYKEGFLWKKGRDNGQYLKRLFILSESEGMLKYTKSKGSEPKGTFPIRSLNAMFQCEKMGEEHGLEITCVQDDGRTRSVYVYHKDGAEIVAWYNALRSARYNYLRKTYPSTAELIRKITRSYTKSGYMEKTGPTQREAFKKRWFNLDSEERKLLYYKKPLCLNPEVIGLQGKAPSQKPRARHSFSMAEYLPPEDPYEQGRIFIGSSEAGYQVAEGLPTGVKGNKWDIGITIRTPRREFILTCENLKEQKEWLQVLKELTSRPMSDQDTAEDAGFRLSTMN